MQDFSKNSKKHLLIEKSLEKSRFFKECSPTKGLNLKPEVAVKSSLLSRSEHLYEKPSTSLNTIYHTSVRDMFFSRAIKLSTEFGKKDAGF